MPAVYRLSLPFPIGCMMRFRACTFHSPPAVNAPHPRAAHTAQRAPAPGPLRCARERGGELQNIEPYGEHLNLALSPLPFPFPKGLGLGGFNAPLPRPLPLALRAAGEGPGEGCVRAMTFMTFPAFMTLTWRGVTVAQMSCAPQSGESKDCTLIYYIVKYSIYLCKSLVACCPPVMFWRGGIPRQINVMNDVSVIHDVTPARMGFTPACCRPYCPPVRGEGDTPL